MKSYLCISKRDSENYQPEGQEGFYFIYMHLFFHFVYRFQKTVKYVQSFHKEDEKRLKV